ncbi:MAG: hypothetical protein KBS54_02340 [Synergistaceae bacterium]|nr:hypothetical protein [Candidatus Equadaptatus faecalis]
MKRSEKDTGFTPAGHTHTGHRQAAQNLLLTEPAERRRETLSGKLKAKKTSFRAKQRGGAESSDFTGEARWVLEEKDAGYRIEALRYDEIRIVFYSNCFLSVIVSSGNCIL